MDPYYQSDFPINNLMGKEEAFATGIATGLMAGYFILIGLFIIALYILSAYSMMKISAKTKRGTPWFAWVPILRSILWLNLGGFSGWYIFLILLCCIPFLGWIAYGLFFIYVWMMICVNCDKPDYLGMFALIPGGMFVLPLYLAFSDKIKKNV